MRKAFFLFMTFALLATGCAARRADLAEPALSGEQPKIVLVKGVKYDQYGLPKFGAVLKDRPTGPGEQYTLVYEVNNRPVKSYEIAVTGERRPDIIKPIKVLFEWTGRGFIMGVRMVYNTGQTEFTKEQVGAVVVLAAGGFIVGVMSGVGSAVEELKCIVNESREMVISSTVYEYDPQGRLKRLRMFLPDEKTEVVRTEYYYGDGESVPTRTESRSYPEDTVRTIGK